MESVKKFDGTNTLSPQTLAIAGNLNTKNKLEEINSLVGDDEKTVGDKNEGLYVERTEAIAGQKSVENDTAKNTDKITQAQEMRESLAKEKASNGWISGAWDWFKDTTGIGAGSKKAAAAIEKFENGEMSQEDAQKALEGYSNGQKMATDVAADMFSGISAVFIYGAAVAAAPFTGGASVAVGIGAAAAAGAAIKTGLKASDCVGNKKTYELKDLGYDLLTGAVNGAMGPISNGLGGSVGTGITKALGKKGLEVTVKETAKAGAKQAVKVAGQEGVEAVTGVATKQIAKNLLKEAAEEGLEGTVKQGSNLFIKMMSNQGAEYVAKEGAKKSFGLLGAKVAANAADMAVDGALSGATDGFARAMGEGRIEDIPSEIINGTFGGLVAAPLIGGGFKLAGKGVGKIFNKVNIDVTGKTVLPDGLATKITQGEVGDCNVVSVLDGMLSNPSTAKKIQNAITTGVDGNYNVKVGSQTIKVLKDEIADDMLSDAKGARIFEAAFKKIQGGSLDDGGFAENVAKEFGLKPVHITQDAITDEMLDRLAKEQDNLVLSAGTKINKAGEIDLNGDSAHYFTVKGIDQNTKTVKVSNTFDPSYIEEISYDDFKKNFFNIDGGSIRKTDLPSTTRAADDVVFRGVDGPNESRIKPNRIEPNAEEMVNLAHQNFTEVEFERAKELMTYVNENGEAALKYFDTENFVKDPDTFKRACNLVQIVNTDGNSIFDSTDISNILRDGLDTPNYLRNAQNLAILKNGKGDALFSKYNIYNIAKSDDAIKNVTELAKIKTNNGDNFFGSYSMVDICQDEQMFKNAMELIQIKDQKGEILFNDHYIAKMVKNNDAYSNAVKLLGDTEITGNSACTTKMLIAELAKNNVDTQKAHELFQFKNQYGEQMFNIGEIYGLINSGVAVEDVMPRVNNLQKFENIGGEQLLGRHNIVPLCGAENIYKNAIELMNFKNTEGDKMFADYINIFAADDEYFKNAMNLAQVKDLNGTTLLNEVQIGDLYDIAYNGQEITTKIQKLAEIPNSKGKTLLDPDDIVDFAQSPHSLETIKSKVSELSKIERLDVKEFLTPKQIANLTKDSTKYDNFMKLVEKTDSKDLLFGQNNTENILKYYMGYDKQQIDKILSHANTPEKSALVGKAAQAYISDFNSVFELLIATDTPEKTKLAHKALNLFASNNGDNDVSGTIQDVLLDKPEVLLKKLSLFDEKRLSTALSEDYLAFQDIRQASLPNAMMMANVMNSIDENIWATSPFVSKLGNYEQTYKMLPLINGNLAKSMSKQEKLYLLDNLANLSGYNNDGLNFLNNLPKESLDKIDFKTKREILRKSDIITKDATVRINALNSPEVKNLSEAFNEFLGNDSSTSSSFIPYLVTNGKVAPSDLSAYIKGINVDELTKIEPRIKNFTPENWVDFLTHHAEMGTKKFNAENLVFPKNLTQYLKGEYVSADKMSKILSQFPATNREIGQMPKGWMDDVAQSERADVVSRVYKSISNFQTTNDANLLADDLSKILNKNAAVETLGEGALGVGHKISVEGAGDTVLKLYKPLNEITTHMKYVHGSLTEPQAAIYAHKNSSEFADFYFGKVSNSTDRDAFMVSKFLGDNPNSQRNPFNVKYVTSDDAVYEYNHNVIDGKIIDFGAMYVKNPELQNRAVQNAARNITDKISTSKNPYGSEGIWMSNKNLADLTDYINSKKDKTVFFNAIDLFEKEYKQTFSPEFAQQLKDIKKSVYVKNLAKTNSSIENPALHFEAYELNEKLSSQEDLIRNGFKGLGINQFSDDFYGRTKGVQSIYDKINKKVKKGLSPEAAISDIQDGIAFRCILPDFNYKNYPEIVELNKTNPAQAYKLAAEKQSEQVVDNLKKVIIQQKQSGNYNIINMHNYAGKNGIPYLSENQLTELEFFAKENDLSLNLLQASKLKDSGYTALQMNIQNANGTVAELQIRGSQIEQFAESEHLIYDTLAGKDVTGGNKKLATLFGPFEKLVNAISKDDLVIYQKYLSENYDYFRRLELGFSPEKPTLPPEFSKMLSIDNLLSLLEKKKVMLK